MDSKPSYYVTFSSIISDIHKKCSLNREFDTKLDESSYPETSSQVNTSVDRWQSDFLLIEMTTIWFGVKLRKKENQKSDLSVQHFFLNIHMNWKVIASWIFEWLLVEKILLANTLTSQFKVIPRKFVHTFSLLK